VHVIQNAARFACGRGKPDVRVTSPPQNRKLWLTAAKNMGAETAPIYWSHVKPDAP
jgi:hypothetical protein